MKNIRSAKRVNDAVRKIFILTLVMALSISSIPMSQAYADTKKEITYTVKRGDTLGKIAKQYNTSVTQFAKLNNIQDVNYIKVGQELLIPGLATKIVKNQSELDEALSSNLYGTIKIESKKAIRFNISNKKYNNIILIVNAPNASVSNKATFQQINIKDLNENGWKELGKKNSFVIEAKNLHMVIDKSATIANITTAKDVDSLTVKNNSAKNLVVKTKDGSVTIEKKQVTYIVNGEKVEANPKPTVVPKPTKKPNSTKKPQPTLQPTQVPQPTLQPTLKPTQVPQPTQRPQPTLEPTQVPQPTQTPYPTLQPTQVPQPTAVPTQTPEPTKLLPCDIADFSTWKLQLPTPNETMTGVEEITADRLVNGYEGPNFYVDQNDGGIVMSSPVDGFKTANTTYSRSELRELIDGKTASVNWYWKGTHILRTSEMVTEVPSNGKTIVSQIHGIWPNGENGPVLIKVQYEYLTKSVGVYIKTAAYNSAADKKFYFSDVDLNQRFDTEIKIVEGVAYVTISSNGRSETYAYDFLGNDSSWESQLGYFKVGNYVQDSVKDYEGEGATVKVYKIETFHDDNFVKPVPIESLVMLQDNVTMGIGETMKLETQCTPIDTVNKAVTWSVVEGNENLAVNNQGVITAIAEGTAKVRATSVENTTVYTECSIEIVKEITQEVKAVYEQNFGTDAPYDITSADEIGLLPSGATNVSVVNEDGNYVLKFFDKDESGSAKAGIYFPEELNSVTVSFKVRVDETEIKDTKNTPSYLYLCVGGSDTWLTSGNEMFRLRNGSTYNAGTLMNHMWLLSHGYQQATMNTDATKFELGEWKEVTIITTPDNGTAKGNMSDVYIDGLKVGSQLSNNFNSAYINQVNFYSGTKDLISFSIDDIKIYSGVKAPESENAAAPESVTLGITPSIMATGDSIRLIATIAPDGAREGLTYSITNGSEYVSVSKDGLITAVKAGTATIRVASASYPEIYDECIITVVDNNTIVRVESLTLAEDNITLFIGQAKDLIPQITPANAAEQGVSFEVISGFDCITVSQTGVVTALKAGAAVVRVKSLDNPKAYVDCNVAVVNNVSPGTIIFSDTFSTALDLSKWETATSNNQFTENKVVDGALRMFDDNGAGQPKAFFGFEPQASTVSMQFKIKVTRDLKEGTDKFSAVTIGFGTGLITSQVNEAFRFKTSGSVSNNTVTNARFVYSNPEGTNFLDTGKNYERNEWYTVTMVTTPDNGSERANTTDIYIDGVKVIDKAVNKNKFATIDKFILQTGTTDLTEYFIDDMKIWTGDYADGETGENPEEPSQNLIYGEDFNNITLGELPVASSETNPSIRPSWKITSASGAAIGIVDDRENNKALKFTDDSDSLQPKALLIFDKATGTTTIEFDLLMEDDRIYVEGTEKASVVSIGVGSTDIGSPSSKAREMFRLKTKANVEVVDGVSVVTGRKFCYEQEDNSGKYIDIPGISYELNTWYTIKLVMTPGEEGTTSIFINGVELVTDALNKKPVVPNTDPAITANTIDSFIIQGEKASLATFWIDNVKIYR
ncbi:polysaccharide lyase family 7 protein [Lachnoclostridium sp.]|nr:polysaccharide lyase family 7 protein [Lachnoclostridium sp.]